MSEFIGHIDLKSWCREVRLTYPLDQPDVDLITLVRMDLRDTVEKFVDEMGMSCLTSEYTYRYSDVICQYVNVNVLVCRFWWFLLRL